MPALPNPKQERFAREVAKTDNQTEAYRIAYGTKSKTPEVGASHLMAMSKVKTRVIEIRSKMGERLKGEMLTMEEICRGCAEIFRTPVGGLTEQHQFTQEFSKTASGKKVKGIDKLKAAELAAKLQGFLVDKVEHSGQVEQTGRIEVVLPEIVYTPRRLGE